MYSGLRYPEIWLISTQLLVLFPSLNEGKLYEHGRKPLAAHLDCPSLPSLSKCRSRFHPCLAYVLSFVRISCASSEEPSVPVSRSYSSGGARWRAHLLPPRPPPHLFLRDMVVRGEQGKSSCSSDFSFLLLFLCGQSLQIPFHYEPLCSIRQFSVVVSLRCINPVILLRTIAIKPRNKAIFITLSLASFSFLDIYWASRFLFTIFLQKNSLRIKRV